MTEEEVKGLLKEASEKIKEDFIPNMTNLIMDVFQYGINKGTEIGVKIGADKRPFSIKWQTGKPKESGAYIVTLRFGLIEEDSWNNIIQRWTRNNGEVIAWCKLSDIAPYKEETK